MQNLHAHRASYDPLSENQSMDIDLFADPEAVLHAFLYNTVTLFRGKSRRLGEALIFGQSKPISVEQILELTSDERIHQRERYILDFAIYEIKLFEGGHVPHWARMANHLYGLLNDGALILVGTGRYDGPSISPLRRNVSFQLTRVDLPSGCATVQFGQALNLTHGHIYGIYSAL